MAIMVAMSDDILLCMKNAVLLVLDSLFRPRFEDDNIHII